MLHVPRPLNIQRCLPRGINYNGYNGINYTPCTNTTVVTNLDAGGGGLVTPCNPLWLKNDLLFLGWEHLLDEVYLKVRRRQISYQIHIL